MEKKNAFLSFFKDHKSLIIFGVLMLVFRSSFADWSDVPTGSMKPTILEGDRITINKMAYDIRIPLSHISLIKIADPARGDIIVFDSHAADKRLVKRVIGLPGDTIAMTNNQLFINGSAITYENTSETSDKLEHLTGANHQIRISNINTSFASFTNVIVPDDHYLVLGDNRDNSADSRVIGFVPRNEIVGRSRGVMVSLDYDNYYLPRSERFFHRL